MAFPPSDDSASPAKPAAKKKPAFGGPPPGGPPPSGAPVPGPGAQQNLHVPPPGMVKPGMGIDPMQAMTQGMGDLSAMGPPPPPAPGAPMGDGGMPVGGALPSTDPGMDPSMDGSSLFQGLNMALDPTMGGEPPGEPGTDPELDQLLQMLALSQAGVGEQDAALGPMGGMMPGPMGPPGLPGMPGMPPRPMGGGMGRLNPSGVMPEPTTPGMMSGLRNFDVIQ